MVRELGFVWSWCRVDDKVGCALRPTAQSGRAGKGCFDEVDVNVRRDEDDVEDCKAVDAQKK